MKLLSRDSKLNALIPKSLLEAFPDSTALIDPSCPWPSKVDSKNIILIAPDQNLARDLGLLKQTSAKHLVHSQRSDFLDEIKLSAQAICDPQAFNTRLPESILGQKTSPLFKLPFKSMSEKSQILKNAKQSLDQIENCKSHEADILNIFDELFTNALYNAPVDQNGQAVNKNRDRKSNVTITDKPSPFLFMYQDGVHLLIGCEDFYGSFDLQGLVSRLEELYRSDLAQARMDTGGAGLGYRMMLEGTSGLYIGLEKSKRTCVCFKILVGEGFKKGLEIPKNLHLISG